MFAIRTARLITHPKGVLGSSALFTPLERFLAQVEKGIDPEACQQWIGRLSKKGYGTFWADGKRMPAHCWAYEYWNGPVPTGCIVHHKCLSPACVNPKHLELMTNEEHTSLHHKGKKWSKLKAFCKRGHPLTGTVRGKRRCAECHRLDERERYRKGLMPTP